MSARIEFEDRFLPEALTGCWLWVSYVSREGYGRMPRKVLGEHSAHRISWRIHVGEIPAGMWVLHKCDNRSCVNPAHLYLGNSDDNIRDMLSRGRHRSVLSPDSIARSELSHAAKLSDEQVARIRALRGTRPQRVIAKEFGISEDYVSRLMRRVYR